jgi:branched-chain amino acid aminotransferase
MSFADRDGLIWFDGEMVPWREARCTCSRTRCTTDSACSRACGPTRRRIAAPAFSSSPSTRSACSTPRRSSPCRCPGSARYLLEAQRAVVRENGLDEAYLRPMCFYGSEGMGLRADNLKTHVIVAAWEWPSYMDPEAASRGIKVRTSSFTRHHVNITMCKAKANGNYINSMLALREALDCGAEEALLLDNEGYVAEGSGENIFIVRRGQAAHAGADLLPRRHHPGDDLRLCARAGPEDHRAPHYPRRGLHRRRGVLHGNRRGGGADS